VPEQRPGEACADHVRDEERRDRQAEHELRRFPEGHAQGAAAVEADQRQDKMREQRAVQQDRAHRAAPPERERHAHAIHGLDRDHAERVVQEMPDHEGRDHQPRDQAKKSHPVSWRDLYSRNSAPMKSRLRGTIFIF
jgi:hypothetical protein